MLAHTSWLTALQTHAHNDAPSNCEVNSLWSHNSNLFSFTLPFFENCKHSTNFTIECYTHSRSIIIPNNTCINVQWANLFISSIAPEIAQESEKTKKTWKTRRMRNTWKWNSWGSTWSGNFGKRLHASRNENTIIIINTSVLKTQVYITVQRYHFTKVAQIKILTILMFLMSFSVSTFKSG